MISRLLLVVAILMPSHVVFAQASERFYTKVHRDLPQGGVNYVSVLLRSTMGPWQEIDGTGGTMIMHDGLLYVRHKQAVQEEVAGLLDAIGKIVNSQEVEDTIEVERASDSKLNLYVVDVKDLGSGYHSKDFIRSLMELTAGPWEAVEGTGGILLTLGPNLGLYVINTDQDNLEEIEDILDQIRN